MRILYIANTSWRGDSIALYNLITGLHRQHDIHVIFPNSERFFCQKLDSIGVTYTLIPYGLNIYPQKTFFLKWLYRLIITIGKNTIAPYHVKKVIKSFRPDIVHCNVGPLDISLKICLKMKIPHVWHQREYQDLDFNMKFIPSKQYYQKKIITKGNYNIAITNGVFNHWNLRPNTDCVIYDGVFDKKQVPTYQPYKKKDDYFLFAGRVQDAKGTLDAIKAFGLFCKKHQNYNLLIAGQYSPWASQYAYLCNEYVKQQGLEDKVTFLGERKDVYSLMSNAQALLVSSIFEGFGFITVEAMLCGCIVIGRDTGGTKEQFDIGVKQSGQEIALRFTTIEELSANMEKVISQDWEDMRQQAFNLVTENYSLQKHIKQVEMYYKKCIDNYTSIQ